MRCETLTSIIMPEGITSIGKSAFYDCFHLAYIKIPLSVTSIGYWAFALCDSLTGITFTGTMEQWKKIYNTDQKIKSGVVVTCSDGTITIE